MIQQLPTNKNTSVGVVGSNTKCQGTKEEYHPPVCWLSGIETLVPAVNPAVAYEPATNLLSHKPEAPGEHCLRQPPMDKRDFVGSIPERSFSYHWSTHIQKKNTSSDALESLNAYEEQFSFIHITLLTRQHSSVPKEIFLSPKFLLLKKVTVCECLSSPSCVECCHISLTSSRIWCLYWTTGEWEEPGKAADRTLSGH